MRNPNLHYGEVFCCLRAYGHIQLSFRKTFSHMAGTGTIMSNKLPTQHPAKTDKSYSAAHSECYICYDSNYIKYALHKL